MFTADQCKAHAEDCRRLAASPGNSSLLTTVLRTMGNSWITLGRAADRYDAIVREDGTPLSESTISFSLCPNDLPQLVLKRRLVLIAFEATDD